jgi:hypothetical protein
MVFQGVDENGSEKQEMPLPMLALQGMLTYLMSLYRIYVVITRN